VERRSWIGSWPPRDAVRLRRLGGAAGALSALSGAALLAASALTRFGIFEAGMASARDPKYTIVPQRQRQPESQDGRL